MLEMTKKWWLALGIFIILLLLFLFGYKSIRIREGKVSIIRAKETKEKKEKALISQKKTIKQKAKLKKSEKNKIDSEIKLKKTAKKRREIGSSENFSESLNRVLTLILDTTLPDHKFYAEGEKAYLQVRNEILSGKISHDELVRFFNHLLSLNTERSTTMAISLGVLSIDEDILNSIYDLYIGSDPYTKSFILEVLKEAHVAENLAQILEEIDAGSFNDDLFVNNLIKGLLINQPSPEVIQWLHENIISSASSNEQQKWFYMINYISVINTNNMQSMVRLMNYLLTQNKNNDSAALEAILRLGTKVDNSDVLLYLIRSLDCEHNFLVAFIKQALNNVNTRAEIIDKIFYYQIFENNRMEKQLMLQALSQYYQNIGKEEEFNRMLDKSFL